MANKLHLLKKILIGNSSQYKSPTNRIALATQKRAFDSFARAATNIYNQAVGGSSDRIARLRDYELMDSTPEISRALDIFSDDATTMNVDGRILEIVSNDERIKSELEELFYERLDIDFHIWSRIRNLCKFGDHFTLLDIAEKEGIIGAIDLPVNEIEREEGLNGDPNSVRFRWLQQGSAHFENYQILHMRMLGNDKYLPYGRSMLDPARRIWKQLQLAEDAMLIYRITRSPERRIFYIDVANIPPEQVESYINNVRDKMKRTPLLDRESGTIDLKYNPQSIEEDFYIAVRGDRSSRIETLPGGTNTGDIDDINYLQNKLFTSIGIPKSYLQSNEDQGPKGSLAQEDIKHARTIQRIQKIVISEFAKAGIIHLYLRGFDESDIHNFHLKMVNPSTVTEMMQLDLLDRRIATAEAMVNSKLYTKMFVQENVLKMQREEIAEIQNGQFVEARRDSTIDKIISGGEDAAGGMFGGFDGTTEDESGEGEADVENVDDEFRSMKGVISDPVGTQNIPGAPNYQHGFLDTKKTNKIKRKDPFDRKITDILKWDSEFSKMLETLSKNIKRGVDIIH